MTRFASEASGTYSLLTRPLSAHPVCPRLHSAISNGACSQARNLHDVSEIAVMEISIKFLRDRHRSVRLRQNDGYFSYDQEGLL